MPAGGTSLVFCLALLSGDRSEDKVTPATQGTQQRAEVPVPVGLSEVP